MCPNKTKQNGLNLLDFICLNLGFSMGYGDSSDKNPIVSQPVFQVSLLGGGSVTRRSDLATV
jgi:hypothetical protein